MQSFLPKPLLPACRRGPFARPATASPFLPVRSSPPHPQRRSFSLRWLSSSPSVAPSPDSSAADREYRVQIPIPFSTHLLPNGPPSSTSVAHKEDLLQMYKDMRTIRQMEISSDQLFKSQNVRGFCHLYDGQEAIAAGLKAALTMKDPVITAYRDHGIFLARDGSVFEVFAELMGKKGGCSRGKGGSMHLFKKENNFFGGWGIVGTTPPLGAGLALALKHNKQENVAVAICGDGADNQGQVYEIKNMAALWDLPLILLIENNHYGMGTAEWRASKKRTYFDRISYLPGVKVDGMDIFAVKEGLRFCKEHCLGGKGPILMECDTYRYHGHSMSDPGSSYRTREEIKNVQQARDPIDHLRKIILKEGVFSEEELKVIDNEVKQHISEALTQAKQSPTPGDNELVTNIYVQDQGLTVQGCDRKQSIYTLS